ncbi:MAG TPA: phage/plasmid primase, P4 family [Treponemataceae bacterium]|nr:phage/plasmid primase, P4 family [Treponemataceae bacterium]
MNEEETELQVLYDAIQLKLDDLIAGNEQFTDLTNAELFVKAYRGQIRYCMAWKKWLIWDNNTWRPDDCGEIFALCKDFLRGLYLQVATISDHKRAVEMASHVIKSESLRRRQALIESAAFERSIRITPKEVDQDSFLLNIQNGTLDLRCGKLLDPMKEKYITKCALVSYEQNALCPIWIKFLNRIMDGNNDLIRFLQKAVGWSLTGDMSEQVMFILYGSGANGKSTFLNTIMEILGEYAMATQTETFTRRNGNTMSNDIARLRGSRFVTTIEAEEGRRLSEPLIKQVTGQDVLTARFLYGEYFDFLPTFKIFMATNHKPVIKGTDLGIWRRIKLIPFTVTIPYDERDPNLMKRLKTEKSGILNWMIEGCLLWQKERLGEPKEVKVATGEYQEEMDLIGSYLTECCITDSTGYLRVTSYDLYRSYLAWCEKNSERPYAQRIFAMHLQNKGFQRERTNKARGWMGIALLSD